jgi:cytochrome P450
LQHCRQQIAGVKKAMDAGEIKPSAIPTMFQQLLTPGITEGYVVPSVDDLKDEAYSVLAAAADTTGNCMTVAAYHVVRNPEIYQKLKAELRAAFPDPKAELDFVSLEKLPYLVSIPILSAK